MEKSTIEILFQDWLNGVKDGFAYILTSAECASRHAFEAGYNTARKNNSESQGTANNTAMPKLLERLEAVQVIVSKECSAEEAQCAYDELDAVIAQLQQ
jgi:hypothetical protein